MESTTTDQQFSGGAETSLSAPHFDEEATVLSARPVVPLATVNGVRSVEAKASFRRQWILGLALVGALMVGVSATAIYHSPLVGNDSKLFDDAGLTAGVEAKTTKAEDSFSGSLTGPPAVNTDRPAALRRQAPAKSQTFGASAEPSQKPVPRLFAVITEKRSRNQGREGSREDRKAARQQARQERRRADREKPEAGSSDVLRIRDIFEGSPRP